MKSSNKQKTRIWYTLRLLKSSFEPTQPQDFKIVAFEDLSTSSSDVKKQYPGYDVTNIAFY